MMVMLLVCVMVAAFLDTDRIMQSSFFNSATLQPLLNLNLLDDSIFESNGTVHFHGVEFIVMQ